MSRKSSIPKFPESYVGKKSNEYDNSIWMERNQKKTTLISIQYLCSNELDKIGLNDNVLPEESIILDLGCGTGFSSEILALNGFKVIAIDILKDMLYKVLDKKEENDIYQKIEFILADMTSLPIRHDSIDHVISISAYNFITYGKKDKRDILKTLNNTAKYIRKVLKPRGRIVIEFYPKDDKELDQFSQSFTRNGFSGFYIKKYESQRSGQTFLLLKKK